MSGIYTNHGYNNYIWVNPWDQKVLERNRKEKETKEKETKESENEDNEDN